MIKVFTPYSRLLIFSAFGCPQSRWLSLSFVQGSIIMMAGSLLQRWTSDNIIAPTHRVAIPNDTRERSSCRQSAAFFVAPDDETIVRCFDGLDKYEPMKTIDHLRKRANKSHITSSQ